MKGTFSYYAGLYTAKLGRPAQQNASTGRVRWQRTGWIANYLLVISACTVNISQEIDKIRVVTEQLDRLFPD